MGHIDISIIIVSFNVKEFLDQAILSVQKASNDLNTEVIVIDNASHDQSASFIREKYPHVKIIENQTNEGFAKANNKGINEAKGEYILLLNPDTLIEENTLRSCFDFMAGNPQAGAVGVRLMDGSGNYLPESKRGFPSPMASISKLFGFSKLFPRSRFFNGYYLGHLSPNQQNKIDVLCGAFMFIRKSVLDHVGLLDEAFFMYGEDIDLSYRINQAGHEIWYLPETSVIHHKGESTKKESLDYVKHFYQSMIIFSKKHFHSADRGLLIFLLKLGIYLRAFISLVKRGLLNWGFRVIHFIFIYSLLFVLAGWWAKYHFGDPNYYQSAPLRTNFAMYSFLWIAALFFSNHLEKGGNFIKIFRGTLIGSILILAIYGMLDQSYRSSRALIIFGTLITLVSSVILQLIWQYLNSGEWRISSQKVKQIAIIGSLSECKRVKEIVLNQSPSLEIKGFVSSYNDEHTDFHFGRIENIDQIIKDSSINELIFCLKDMDIHQVMKVMNKVGQNIEYKIIGDEANSIIGSKSKNYRGELYSIDFNFKINQKRYRRAKRLFDIVTSFIFLLFSPIISLFQIRPVQSIKNAYEVLIGNKSWVSYHLSNQYSDIFPKIRPGILHPLSGKNVDELDPKQVEKVDLHYAKNYSWNMDLNILISCFRSLGNENV